MRWLVVGQDFNRSWREVEKLGTDEGSNIRLFRAEFEDPSPNSDKLEKAILPQPCPSRVALCWS